ncbi:glutaredoxin family protein [Bhargavaea ginsengi]|uniref:glutaredoxin family protein n=1 Tax=Bhargavaea ginsengi TaxID=426757 RepID=UPI00203F1A15|nr:glutaredoxin domain-containing protein [Bhargavaea ginsengi]MCM3088762.1 glutaredoxin family protein [Bhargavaea ginsengi]
MEPNVIIYTNTICPVCAMVRSFLADHDIPYREVNVDLHPIEMLKLIGKTRRLTVPQTCVNGTFISGFDPVGILKLVHPS